MHRSKLFRALVIGGSMTALTLGGCGDENSPNPSTNTEQNESADTQDTNSTQTDTDDNTTPTDNETDTDNEEVPDDQSTDPETEPETDPSDDVDPSSSEEPADTATELAPCFCDSEPSCCEEVDGEAQAIDGFECCWGTSC